VLQVQSFVKELIQARGNATFKAPRAANHKLESMIICLMHQLQVLEELGIHYECDVYSFEWSKQLKHVLQSEVCWLFAVSWPIDVTWAALQLGHAMLVLSLTTTVPLNGPPSLRTGQAEDAWLRYSIPRFHTKTSTSVLRTNSSLRR
jgi:hypothetical protein